MFLIILHIIIIIKYVDFSLNSVEIPSFDCTAYVEKFLQTIKSLQPQSYGIKSVIHFLLGSKKKVFVNMSVNNKYFGMGSDKSEDWWNQLGNISN